MSRKQTVPTKSAGATIARHVIAQRQAALARRAKVIAIYTKKRNAKTRGSGRLNALAAPQTIAYLVAAGDSWFDYPGEFPLQSDDILSLLEEAGYTIESSAHAGDPIEAMAYNGSGQIYKLATCFEKVAAQNALPKAVLLSGGGDDIAGAEFGMLLNNANASIAGWNDEVVDGVINQRIADSYHQMIQAIDTLSQHYANASLPILVHGYDYAVPDGRGFLGGWWVLPGPWLQPGFNEKQFTDLGVTTPMVRDLIDRFNAMLQKMAATYPFVHYIDLRGTLSNALTRDAYQKWWANELHPTPNGFEAVTSKFVAALEAL